MHEPVRGSNFALTECIWSFSVKIWWQDPMLMPTSSATSWTVIWFPQITAWTLDMVVVSWCGRLSRPGIFTDRHSALFKMLELLIALCSAHTVLPICLVNQIFFTKFATKFHTHTHTHTCCSSICFIATLSLIWWTACACAQFSKCSSTTNAHSKTGQIAVCCQNLMLGALSSRSALSVLVGALFKKFGLFLNTPRISIHVSFVMHLPEDGHKWPKHVQCRPIQHVWWTFIYLYAFAGFATASNRLVHSYVKVKVKLELPDYRPWYALRVPQGWGSQILRQSANEGGKVVSPTHRSPLPPGKIPGTHFC
jgi:hypothetical protein